MIAGEPTSLLSHLHVLIAEDDALIAFDMEQTLTTRFGFKVSVVHSLDDGLEVLRVDPPHLAILDFDLGGNSTEPLATELSRHGAPIVFVSGYKNHPLNELAGELKLEKPHDSERLVDMIRLALGRLAA